ncbi:MAG: hypothetical protein JW715_07015 [Sedimentisphaerales bacterium]|nr:hypothetical protein [Sedimentisphaerales bacterium]
MYVTISIIISLSSLIIAALALGWNIYRDVIMKGRVKIRFGWRVIIDGQKSIPDTIMLSGVNHGPGKVVLSMIIWKRTSLLRWLHRKAEQGFIKLTDKPSEYSDMLPKELDIGDEINLIFPSNAGFAKEDFTHIGLRDQFYRVHWARRKDVKIFNDRKRA